MPACRTNRRRRARARKRQVAWNRKNWINRFIKLGGDYIRERLGQESFTRKILEPRSALRVAIDEEMEARA